MRDLPAADVAVIENPECDAERRTLLKFDLPDQLAGVTIELAIVEFRASVTSSDTTGVLMLDAFPVTAEWSSGTAAWTEGWDTPGGDFDRSQHGLWAVATGQNSLVKFDVTGMVRAWVSGSSTNQGLIVQAASGMIGGAEPVSAVGGRSGLTLTVYYTPPAATSAQAERGKPCRDFRR